MALPALSIPSGVMAIGEHAFSRCRSFSSPMVLPESITAVSNGMFNGCCSLTSVKLPDGTTSIGGRAFAGSNSLKSITIPAGVTSIGNLAFAACGSLGSIMQPDGMIKLEEGAFIGCENLETVYIPGSVSFIGDIAFRYCPRLRIFGAAGSFTETYAAAEGIPFSRIIRQAAPSSSAVTIDGKKTAFEAYNIEDNNYFSSATPRWRSAARKSSLT